MRSFRTLCIFSTLAAVAASLSLRAAEPPDPQTAGSARTEAPVAADKDAQDAAADTGEADTKADAASVEESDETNRNLQLLRALDQEAPDMMLDLRAIAPQALRGLRLAAEIKVPSSAGTAGAETVRVYVGPISSRELLSRPQPNAWSVHGNRRWNYRPSSKTYTPRYTGRAKALQPKPYTPAPRIPYQPKEDWSYWPPAPGDSVIVVQGGMAKVIGRR